MAKLIGIFFFLYLLTGCTSIKKYNSSIHTLKSEKQLQTDVDYIYKKLQKLHPNLYWYISKKELDFKFDSLKASIVQPMTSNDFYMKLTPVISSIGQGHIRVYPLLKKIPFKQKLWLLNEGTSPLTRLDLEIFNEKLYVVKNNSCDTSIKAGEELVSVNDTLAVDLLSKYKNSISSDGYNQTFKPQKLAKEFSSFFYFQYGTRDSVLCKFRYNDSLKTVCLKRKIASDSVTKKTVVKYNPAEQKRRKEENRKKRLYGYDNNTRSYSKNLSFPKVDSSIAIMKINDFYKGKGRKFYAQSFDKIRSAKTQTLILDLRDNPGGKLREVCDLYSYLTDTNFYFIERAEVASKTSLLQAGYFRGNSLGVKAVMAVFYPIYLTRMGFVFFKVRKDETKKYYYTFSMSKLSPAKPNTFKGKVYVLINGGSFSASCILSSNLKGSKRATFVGEETGGAFNGTVAGIMPVYTLPKSKLKVRFGLGIIRPYYKTDVEGHGIFPDVEIIPKLEDRVRGEDPELEWILHNIGKDNNGDIKRN